MSSNFTRLSPFLLIFHLRMGRAWERGYLSYDSYPWLAWWILGLSLFTIPKDFHHALPLYLSISICQNTQTILQCKYIIHHVPTLVSIAVDTNTMKSLITLGQGDVRTVNDYAKNKVTFKYCIFLFGLKIT